MSLASIDGVLPSAIKKLLAGELPGIKSSHVSEGLAAGCGYRSNTAYLADLRAGPVRFVPASRLDTMAMSARLHDILGGDPIAIQNLVCGAVARIAAHVSGDIVPLGTASTVAPAPAPAQDVFAPSFDIMAEAILALVLPEDPVIDALRRRFVEVLVPAVRWISRARPRPSIPDLIDGTHLDAFTYLLDGLAFPMMPDRIRDAAQNYLLSLSGYSQPASWMPDSARVMHEKMALAVRNAIYDLGNDTPRDWLRTTSARLFPRWPRRMSVGRYGIHVDEKRKRLHDLVLTHSWNVDHTLLRRLVDAAFASVAEDYPFEEVTDGALACSARHADLAGHLGSPDVAAYVGTIVKLTDGADYDSDAFREWHSEVEKGFGELLERETRRIHVVVNADGGKKTAPIEDHPDFFEFTPGITFQPDPE